MTAPTPDIAVKQLDYSVNGQSILENVNLTIDHGDFTALIGPNGGGKTTLLKLMLGLIKPDRGRVRIFGEPPGTVARRLGYVPQDIGINRRFPISVMDVVLMGRLRAGRRWPGRRRADCQAAQRALEQVEMWAYRDRRIAELSGGQRQRVFIARALATEPEILLLDEPTASVDTRHQSDFYEILRDLNESATIVIVCHDLMMISTHVKSVACVNRTVHYHDGAEITPDMVDMYHCPVELITHGQLPHRVLRDH